jgi:DNA-binding beta-propeller fold protein YncE
MGMSDGHVDTVSVIDLAAEPPRVIDKVVVGDAPEGLAISPTGQVAVAVLLNGSAGVPKDAWFANPSGKVVVLEIDGKKVTKTGEVDVGGLPEGVVFSKDGGHLYVGNYTDGDVSVLKVDGSHGHQHRAGLAAARASRVDARQPSVARQGRPGSIH